MRSRISCCIREEAAVMPAGAGWWRSRDTHAQTYMNTWNTAAHEMSTCETGVSEPTIKVNKMNYYIKSTNTRRSNYPCSKRKIIVQFCLNSHFMSSVNQYGFA